MRRHSRGLLAAVIASILLVVSLQGCGAGEYSEDTVAALLGLRGSTIAALFSQPISDDLHTGIKTFFDDESRCGSARDCIESIDTMYEAYSLASYLFLHLNDQLRQPIRQEDLTRHRALQDPATVEKKLAIERLDAEAHGDLLRRNSETFRESFWYLHLETNRRNLLSSLQRFRDERNTVRQTRETLMVLGAGSCADIPLQVIAEDFDVILIDIDLPSMQVARSRLPQRLQSNVTLEVRDLSGGIVVSHSREFERIIAESQNSAQAMDRLADFMDASVVPTPLLEGQHRVDVLVSSMLVSQVSFYLVMHIVERLQDPDIGLEGKGWSVRFDRAVRTYSSRIHDAHAEALSDFCIRSGGLVYYSSDLYLTRSMLGFETARDVVPNLQGFRIQSLWHDQKPLNDIGAVFTLDDRLKILANWDPWIWEHFHPALQESWSPPRIETACAPTQQDSCWTTVPQRFKWGRRFYVDAAAFTRH